MSQLNIEIRKPEKSSSLKNSRIKKSSTSNQIPEKTTPVKITSKAIKHDKNVHL